MAFDPITAKPREVEAYLSEVIRKAHGNDVQDAATIKASHGSFHVTITIDKDPIEFHFKKKSVPRIVKAIRALAI